MQYLIPEFPQGGSCIDPLLESALTNILGLLKRCPYEVYRDLVFAYGLFGLDLSSEDGIHHLTCYIGSKYKPPSNLKVTFGIRFTWR